MGALRVYLRQHPWQRRILSALIAIILGASAAMLLYPLVSEMLLARRITTAPRREAYAAIGQAFAGETYSDRLRRAVEQRLFADAGAESAHTRRLAGEYLVYAARMSDATLRRMDRALNRADNARTFETLGDALARLGRLRTPGRPPAVLDRHRARTFINPGGGLDAAQVRQLRRGMLVDWILADRDNSWIRQAMRASLDAGDPRTVSAGALLAGRLGDGEAVLNVLSRIARAPVPTQPATRPVGADDAEPFATAALVAGFLRLGGAENALKRGLERWRSPHAAWALLRLDPERYAPAVIETMLSTDDSARRDRLACTLAVGELPDARRRDAVERFASRREPNGFAPAAAIWAAGRANATEVLQKRALPVLRDVTGDAASVYTTQLLAAIGAIRRTPIDALPEALAAVRELWGPTVPLTCLEAARLLGEQVERNQRAEASPGRGESIQALRQAAMFAPAEGDALLGTPFPSAAAAVGLWDLESRLADEYVRAVSRSEKALPGDYLAWHLARGRRRGEAFELALAMLPPPIDPTRPVAEQPEPVYNDNERAAGAMLLTLAAEGEGQRTKAIERIRSRHSGPLGGEDDFFVRGTYECALAILGDGAYRGRAMRLLEMPEFPRRRALTAALHVRRDAALDYLLWNPSVPDDDRAYLLTVLRCAEVVAAKAPQLPRLDPTAPPPVRRFQLDLMRIAWALRDRVSGEVP